MPRHPTDIFAHTAWYYARYRPAYPRAFFEHVVARCRLDGAGRLLDLGCGPGTLTLPLARHVADAIGLDPEPEMLAEAARAAAAAGIDNARWLLGSDRDLLRLAPQIGPVRLATMGRSFHWMAQDATLADLDQLLEPGGCVVVMSDSERIFGVEGEWQAAVRAALARWVGAERRAGSGVYRNPHDPFEVILARSPFARVETYTLRYSRSVTLDDLLGYLASTSYASPAVLGAQRAAFEDDLRATLLALEPSGVLHEEITLDAWLAWRW
ncbi:MAG: class I SAM-dependent methyltransferase [Chloroflexi bacterium]|nr:MAG: class I SAM-dependent methyltransferase [Chloroflexota bacterium]